MKRMMMNRKALSPVISTVLMMLAVIIGMSLLFAFFVNYTKDFQLGSGSAVLESMTVEDVWFRDASTVEVWVYNLGKVDFKINSVYVNDLQVASDAVVVGVGAHGKLTITTSLSHGSVYQLKLVTERGTTVEGRYVWQ
jgi:flagellin-like protein